jgi:4-amino-4-deoxy-L-arabinose transferase-like glycosyltransferase
MSSPRLLLLFLFFTLLYTAGNWALPLIDRDEPRFAEASREMLQRRDFVVPYFNNDYRFDKPPLIYWLQDATYVVLGDNELAARLPSAICAALAVVIVAVWGARLYGEATGWRAAIMFGLCVQTLVHAHAAVADMAMVAASVASAWAGWNWLTTKTGKARTGWWLAFWALLAVGFLAKGPIAWAPIGMAIWTASRLKRDERPSLLAWLAGAAIMMGLVGIWGIPAMIRTHGQFAVVGLGKHVVMRSVSPLEGHGGKTGLSYILTFPYYFVTVWLSFLPWSLWFPAAIAALWARRKTWAPEEHYLIAGIVVIFGIFTLSWTKLPHYTLPAFPYLALLAAASWARRRPRLFKWVAVLMVAGSLAFTLGVLPLLRPLFVSQMLYDQAAPYLTRGMELATIDYHEPSLVWLFRKKIYGFETSMNWKDTENWMAQPGPRVCVIETSNVDRAASHHLNPAWVVVKASGYDVANAHQENLTAIIKTK